MAPTDVITVPSEPSWDESIWEELLAYIEEERVIPIIGSASFTVANEGRQISLEGYVAEKLVPRLGLPADALPSSPTLNEVVSLHLNRKGRREAVYPRIRDIVRDAAFTPPKVLRQLAEIRHFNLFVTTAFDPLLEAAINDVRFGGKAGTQAIAYATNKVQDLEKIGGLGLIRPTVYYLFGRLSALPTFPISDEDLLEILYALQSESLRPARLFDELERNHLLIVGGTFSDWVARMFLRNAKRRRLSDPRDVLEILADDRSGKDPGLVAFLGNFSPRTKIFHAGAEAFVEALSEQWHRRFSATGGPEPTQWALPLIEMPEGAIFVSYAREDLDAARTLKSALDEAGLPVWFDLDRLGPGDTFDLKIQDYVKRCSLFLPLLSPNTEARTEGFFRREWNYALDRDKGIDQGTPFIIPVAIDDNPQLTTLPRRFREINITKLPGGRPSPDFVERLKHIGGRR
jgi:TIR domain/SIR2-like domain